MMSRFQLSACLELLFCDSAQQVPGRVRAAAQAGCDGVEFWTWREKPLDAVAAAAADAGLAVTMMIVEPQGHLVDPTRLPEFLHAVRESADAAARIGCRSLVAVSGNARPRASAVEQNDAIVRALRAAAPIAGERGVSLLLEPLNTRRDHPGCHLSDTVLGLDLVERVDRPEVRLLYDVYHSVMMGEEPARVIDGRGELLGHVHVADTDGRHEPGTGTVDWGHTISVLWDAGYRGFLGLEYLPTVDTVESMRAIRDALDHG